MLSLRRPSTIIALVLTSAVTTGCLPFICGDMTVENSTNSYTFYLESEGMVMISEGDFVDPTSVEGCEAMCEAVFDGTVTTIHSCESEIDVVSEDADSGMEDIPLVDMTCVVSGEVSCEGGRHSSTLQRRAAGRGEDITAAWLAREACAEAGSVHAFRQLVRELLHHGAPLALVDAARAAAVDEIRHTRMVRRLALRRGGTPAPVRVQHTPPRGLLAIAMENAVEGCVHETFAAARAGWQARHAADPQLRAVSAVLARDESRHADLAAAVHQWACSILPPEQAAAVEDARQSAWSRLAQHPPAVTPAASRVLGLPDAQAHRQLVSALSQALAA
ncbi:MAG: ferritin-like domain-containing protein [Myxococcota bacterium]|nr:ferritin-like domain-containing protein [Myxococcota bacterium]